MMRSPAYRFENLFLRCIKHVVAIVALIATGACAQTPPGPPVLGSAGDGGGVSLAGCSLGTDSLTKLCPPGTVFDGAYGSQANNACQANVTTKDSVVSVCIPSQDQSCKVSCKVAEGLCQWGVESASSTSITCNKGPNGGCTVLGAQQCSPDHLNVQTCVNNLWTASTVCTSDQACDDTSKQCVLVAAYCSSPGAYRCVSEVARQVCGADHRWAAAPCPIETPLCTSPGGVAACQAGFNLMTNSQYRARVVVGTIQGQSAGPNGKAIFGEPALH